MIIRAAKPVLLTLSLLGAALPSPASAQSATDSTSSATPRDCTVLGTEEGDFLLGTEDDDVICALGGDDIIHGLGGDDIIFSGSGDDLIMPGSGKNQVDGGGGVDTISGGVNTSLVRGSSTRYQCHETVIDQCEALSSKKTPSQVLAEFVGPRSFEMPNLPDDLRVEEIEPGKLPIPSLTDAQIDRESRFRSIFGLDIGQSNLIGVREPSSPVDQRWLTEFGVVLNLDEGKVVETSFERRDKIDDLVETISHDSVAGLEGISIDLASEQTLVLHVTDVSAIQEIVKTSGVPTELVRIVPVNETSAELLDAANKYVLSLNLQDEAATVLYDASDHSVDVRANESLLSEDQRSELVGMDDAGQFDVIFQTSNVKFLECYNRSNSEPIGSGNSHHGCTLNVPVRFTIGGQSHLALLTAGHCYINVNTGIFTPPSFPTDNIQGTSYTASAWIDDTAGIDVSLLDLGVYQSAAGHNLIANTLYERNVRWLDLLSFSRSAQQGDFICNTGSGTEQWLGAANATQCGTVSSTPSSGYHIGSPQSCAGNSGGPVFSYINGQRAIVGLVEGESGATTVSYNGGTVCSANHKYTPFIRATSHIKTSTPITSVSLATTSPKRRTIMTFYERLLARAPDSAGINYWESVGGYACTTASTKTVLVAFATGAELTSSLPNNSRYHAYLRMVRLHEAADRHPGQYDNAISWADYIIGGSTSSTREARWQQAVTAWTASSFWDWRVDSYNRVYSEPPMCWVTY